jgi:hypothetical protein
MTPVSQLNAVEIHSREQGQGVPQEF